MFRIIVLFLFIANSFMAQTYSISGKVINGENGKPLMFANIFIKELKKGTVANKKGRFEFKNVSKGIYHLSVSYLGFQKKIKLLNLNKNLFVIVKLQPILIELNETIVKGKKAKLRKTPIAFSDVRAGKIETNLGSRYITNILESVPGVYVSNEGSGFGDNRLTIRGFNQTDISVMINGIPINNPENGEVYWTNWADLSDVVDYIQVQRGLSAIPYSTSSIGGAINIVTSNGFSKGNKLKIKMELASDNFKKTAITFSEPLFNNSLRIKGLLSYADWNGFAYQTWAKMFTYYFSLSGMFGKNFIEIQFLGSPQKHGQRLTPQTISTWQKYGLRYNADWGYLHGKPLNLRDNQFNKPSLTIHHIWQASSNFLLTNVLYLSHGKGGGHVPPWSGFPTTSQGQIDFDKVWEINSHNIDSTFSKQLHRSVKAIRFTYHIHNWLAFRSDFKYSLNNLSFTFGVDGYFYKAENYSTLGNLLGGDYYIGSGNVNDNPNRLLKTGDKVDYDADSYANSLGGFSQVEFNTDILNAYLNVSVARTSYDRIDYFNYLNSDPRRETGWKNFTTYTFKTGVNFNIDSKENLFLNFGKFSRAPLSMNVYNYFNQLYKDVKNEDVISLELGYGLRSNIASLKINLYYTFWKNKAMTFTWKAPNDFSFYYMNIYGARALNKGVEFTGKFNLLRNFSLDAMFSYNYNIWLDDIQAVLRPEGRPRTEIKFYSKVKNQFIGNYPQINASLSFTAKKYLGSNFLFTLNPVYFFHGKFFAQFDPVERYYSNERIQSWRAPDFYRVDLHTSLEIFTNWVAFNNVTVNFSIFNLFNNHNIIRAYDGPTHEATSAKVWFNRERWYDFGLIFKF